MELTQLVERILQAMAPYEFRTFVLGFDRGSNYHREQHEAAYRDSKRWMGEELTRRRPGIDADFLRPELRVDIAPTGAIRLQSAPLFLGGRYRKLSREIPATRWIHHACAGRGCPSCSHTGNLCGPSVQELLEAPLLHLTGGQKTMFHGLGREDVDARMLGPGRPFVLEVHHPLRRQVCLDQVREEFHRRADGLAEITGLTVTGSESRTEVKTSTAEKTYRAWIDLSSPPDTAVVESIEALRGTWIRQLSPTRVMHRRGAAAVRRRRIIESSWIGKVDGRHAWELRVEAGTYVKELVSGDDGRTQPSLAELIGSPCRCDALDVLDIHCIPSWETPGSTGAGAEHA